MKNPLNKNIKVTLLYLLLIIMAVTTVSVFKAHTFQSLNNEAMEFAQIARNISEGKGLATDIIPVPTSTGPSSAVAGKFVPEIHRPPLYPVLLAGAFGVRGIADHTVTEFSTLLYVLSVVLLFALAQRVLKRLGLAFAVAGAYLFSVSVLSVAVSGYAQILSAVLVLAFLLALTPKDESEIAPAAKVETGGPLGARPKLLAGNNFFLAGVLAALCYLADYTSIFYVVPLAILWPGVAKKWDRAGIITFLGGFVIVAAPWWIRNFKLTGDPFYSSEWLVLTAKDPNGPTPLSNWKLGLTGFFYNAVTVPHLLLTPFVIISFWIRPASAVLAKRLMGILLAALIAIVGLSAVGRNSSAEMVPLACLLTLVGLVTFVQIVSTSWLTNSIGKKIAAPLRFEAVPGNPSTFKGAVTKAVKFWQFYELKFKLMSLLRLPVTMRRSGDDDELYAGKWPLKSVFEARAVIVLIVLLLVPLGLQIAFTPVAKPADVRAALQPLVKLVAANRVVVSDIPQAVAWYTDRKAMPLPARATQFLELAQPDVGALYLADLANAQRSPEWAPAYNRTDIPGYENVPLQNAREVLYMKLPSVEEARRIAKTDSKQGAKGAQASAALGQTLLRQRDFPGALAAFTKAQDLKPDLAEAYIGAGFAKLNMKDFAGARTLFARGLQLSPRFTQGLLGMAQIAQVENQPDQAILYYEKILADLPNNSLALNNLASLYDAKGGNNYRALEMARRAAAANPNNGSILDTLGWICFRMGYKQEAAAYLKLAAKLSPNNPTIVGHYKQAQAQAPAKAG